MSYTIRDTWTGETLAAELSAEDVKQLGIDCVFPESIRIETGEPLQLIRDVLGVEVLADNSGNEFLCHPNGSLELITA